MMKDAEYSENHIDVSKTQKRLVRISSKNYEQTGTYISLKLFKRETKEGEFQFSQRVTVSLDEFQAIIDHLPKIKRMLDNNIKTEKITTVKEKSNTSAKKRKAEENADSITEIN